MEEYRRWQAQYREQLQDPRWQKKRLEIFQRDHWTCQECGRTDRTLHVHHRYYITGLAPWEYPDYSLVTYCDECHAEESEFRPQVERYLLHVLKKCGLRWTDLALLANICEQLIGPQPIFVAIDMITKPIVESRLAHLREHKSPEEMRALLRATFADITRFERGPQP